MNIFKRIRRKLKVIARDFFLDHYYRKYRSSVIPFSNDYFKNKRVALVGAADSAFLEKKGAYIDGFDVVVRINKGVEAIADNSEFIGTRTDILFHSLNSSSDERVGSPITIDLWKRHEVKLLQFSYNKVFRDGYQLKKFLKETKGSFKVGEMSKDLFLSNESVIAPYSPTNGFIAFNTIVQCMPKELYITGMTFFKTPHGRGYRPGDKAFWDGFFKSDVTNHNPDSEYQYAKQMYLKYPSVIKPDETLMKIFQTN